MQAATRLVRFEAAPGDPTAPTSTPIHQTATFAQPSALGDGPYDYSRSGNPTRAVLEDQLAALEGAAAAFAFTSGMAALSAVSRLAACGQRILAGADLYGGCWRMLTRLTRRQGIQVDFVDTTDLAAVDAELERGAALLLIETPTNPLLQISDLRQLSARCRGSGTLLAVDSSLMTPLGQRPLEHGADLVIHSATKGLGGHGDLTAGVVACATVALAEEIGFLQNAEGTALAPFESWLLLRGMKTLALRLRQQEANAGALADVLARHPAVTDLYWPGREDHPGAELHRRQAELSGPVLGFRTGCRERSRRIVEAARLFTIAVSFGSTLSQISMPCRMSHASIPDGERALPEDLVRISVGIEAEQDLVADLRQALDAATPAEVRS